MVMPGDRIKMEVELIQPIAIEMWLQNITVQVLYLAKN
jgi:translation elongation factor EF-Tu-like GTPase